MSTECRVLIKYQVVNSEYRMLSLDRVQKIGIGGGGGGLKMLIAVLRTEFRMLRFILEF